MMAIIIDRAPASPATAVKENLYAMFEYLGQSAKATVHLGEYGFRWRTSLAHSWFNGVLSRRPAGHDAAQVAWDSVTYFKESGVTGISWWLSPEVDSQAWARPLRDNGFQYSNQTPGMAIDLHALPLHDPGRLAIRRVENGSTLADYVRTLVRGFGMPDSTRVAFADLLADLGLEEDRPLRHYLGYLDGKPVATSALFLGSDSAGIYNVATVPAARNQGFATAMTMAPLYEARAIGFQTGVLQSSDMGYRMYQRMGFQTVCQVDYFYWQA
jgi:ribosomal protein S18 acetylase RimI-like enzyme